MISDGNFADKYATLYTIDTGGFVMDLRITIVTQDVFK